MVNHFTGTYYDKSKVVDQESRPNRIDIDDLSFLPQLIIEKLNRIYKKKSMNGKLRTVKVYVGNPNGEKESVRYSFSYHLNRVGVQYTTDGIEPQVFKLSNGEFSERLRDGYSKIIQAMTEGSRVKILAKNSNRSLHVRISPISDGAISAYQELLQLSLSLNIHS